MKRLIALVIILGILKPAHAEWRGDVQELGIPRNITTEKDLERHVKNRKRIIIAGVISMLAGGAMYAYSAKLHTKAERTDPTPGPVLLDPFGKGYQEFFPSIAERQSKYFSQASTYKKASVGTLMLGTLLLSIAFSIRF